MRYKKKLVDYNRKKQIVSLFLICILLTGCGMQESTGMENDSTKNESTKNENIENEGTDSECTVNQEYRNILYSLVSSAENSSLDYNEQYRYIEDIGDGRGYTAGVIGFTSGTGDLLEVINKYIELKPENNKLKQYIPALEAVNGTDSHEGLGDAFVTDWSNVAEDSEMIAAQDDIVDEMYLTPAIQFAKEDGLGLLGLYIYYDALVVHGPGEDGDSFGGIRKVALGNAVTPKNGGDEAGYLLAFLDARCLVMLKEEAHSDLSRIEAQRKFIKEENFDLSLPLSWTMYGEKFALQ